MATGNYETGDKWTIQRPHLPALDASILQHSHIVEIVTIEPGLKFRHQQMYCCRTWHPDSRIQGYQKKGHAPHEPGWATLQVAGFSAPKLVEVHV